MPQLIGTASNQVPTNGDLGSAAYMDTSAFYSTGLSASFRNRIINGDMRIDQRNSANAVTPSSTIASVFLADRWACRNFGASAASRFSYQLSSLSPEGFVNSLVATTVSAYTLAVDDAFQLRQPIEGVNIADFGWGTANAKPVTLSFWVRSSLIGTFGGAMWNSVDSRFNVFSYTINAANTWEKKSITIAGETTGAWNTTTSVGVMVSFSLGAHSNLQGSAGVWNTSVRLAPTGQVNLAAVSGATFYLTGVQLEPGTQATPFEFRPNTIELALCQRYYWQSFEGQTPSGWPSNGFLSSTGVGGSSGGNSTGMINGTFSHPVKMRAAPSGSVWDHVNAAGKISAFNPNVSNWAGETGSVVNTSPTTFMINRNSGSAATQVGAHVALSAELP
jgi:hypothetical protein